MRITFPTHISFHFAFWKQVKKGLEDVARLLSFYQCNISSPRSAMETVPEVTSHLLRRKRRNSHLAIWARKRPRDPSAPYINLQSISTASTPPLIPPSEVHGVSNIVRVLSVNHLVSPRLPPACLHFCFAKSVTHHHPLSKFCEHLSALIIFPIPFDLCICAFFSPLSLFLFKLR